MSSFEIREEVLNVVLAEFLSERGLLSIPESIRRSVTRGRRLPDVTIADLWGIRIVIEGRIGDGRPVRDSLFKDASARVEEGLSPFCLAVLYPSNLRRVASLANLRNELAEASLMVRVISETSQGDWSETTIDGLTEILRRSYELLVSEDVVATAVEDLGSAIERASELLAASPATPERIRKLLGIPKEKKPKSGESERTCRIGSLTLVNALIFHQIIADLDPDVESLAGTISNPYPAEAIAKTWEFILKEIDYIPIFTLALDIVIELSGNPGFNDVLQGLGKSAMRITGRRAALRHDLMGRIYHRLLADAKYFGAFYTSVPAATLLLKLALDPSYVPVDWSKINTLEEFRIADLACGTGTLLKAALQTIVDNHVRACGEKKETPELKSLHQALLEKTIWGFDVIPFAIHLAASAMAIHEPDVQFGDMHLYTLALRSARYPRLGSLDFLISSRLDVQADLFGKPAGQSRMTRAGHASEAVEVPRLDLCVMNPPFTRSVGGNLLFGNLPDKQRARLQTELKRIVRRKRLQANITAGLGSVFSALGHKLVKEGGHLALVLPRALLSGVAWEETRKLIGSSYYLRYIIVSHEPGSWNFSENTDLSECLIVAKRLGGKEDPGATKFINLWIRPKSSIEALTVANLVKSARGVKLDTETGITELRTNGKKFAEVILGAAERIKAGKWNEESIFAQTELCRAAYFLVRGQVYLPGQGHIGGIPLIELSALGDLGPDVRDIHDGFQVSDSPTPYSAFWGHDTESIQHIAQNPNRHLVALAEAKEGRPLRDPHLLWSRSARLLISERLWYYTTRVTCVHLPEKALSNMWWPLQVEDTEELHAEDTERIIALWLNSSLGILSLMAARVDTRGPWVKMKKPILYQLKVLNPYSLSHEQRQNLLEAYNDLSKQDLRKLPEVHTDEVRSQIDSAFMSALGIAEDLTPLRQMISIEPLIAGH